MAPKDLPVLVVMALTGVSLQYIIQFVGMTYTSVTNTALLINMGTFFVIIPSALFLKEKLSADNMLGVVIAFIGAVIVATRGNLSFSPKLLGDGLIVICAAMWAVYILIGNKLAGKYSVLTQLNWIFMIGFVCLVPFYLITPHHALASFSVMSWECILYLAIFCSIIAYFVFNDAIIKIGPSKTAIYQYLEPFFAIILAILILSEPLAPAIFVGALFIIAGIAILWPFISIAFAILILSEPLALAIFVGALFIMAGIAMADNNLKIIGFFLTPKEAEAADQVP